MRFPVSEIILNAAVAERENARSISPIRRQAGLVVNCAYGYQEESEKEKEDAREKGAEETVQEETDPQEEVSEEKEAGSRRAEKGPRLQETRGKEPDRRYGRPHSRRTDRPRRRTVRRPAGALQSPRCRFRKRGRTPRRGKRLRSRSR